MGKLFKSSEMDVESRIKDIRPLLRLKKSISIDIMNEDDNLIELFERLEEIDKEIKEILML
jgi:hypothetical protein